MKNLSLLLSILIVLFSCKSKNKPINIDSIKKVLDFAYMDSARADFKNGKLKYYYHAIALPNAKFLKIFQDSLHIKIAGIDRPNKQENSYNFITDSIVKAKTGKSILDWLRDSK